MTSTTIKKTLLVSLLTNSFLLAQETTTNIGEVVVNANKIEENILEVPQSITVLSKENIEIKGIKNIQDVIKEIPNMYIDSTGFTTFRGLNYSIFTSNNPIVLYLDGIPYSSYFDFNPSLDNVEQIEVLRGPQGTLYGKDAIGGVINIITKDPKNEFVGKIQTEYGNDKYSQTLVNLSGALIDNTLYSGINASYKSDEGYLKNTYPNSKKDANSRWDRKTSAFLLFKPNDNFKAKLTFIDNEEKRYLDDFVVKSSIDVNSINRDKIKKINLDIDSFSKTKVKAQALNLEYETDNFNFTSTTTHKDSETKIMQDGSYLINDNSFIYNNNESRTYSQELKLTSKNQSFKWVTGLYFDKDDIKNNTGLSYSMPFLIDFNSKQKNQTQAIFGQTMIPLGEDFELTLGGRYQRIKKELNLKKDSSILGLPQPRYSYDDEKSWNSFLPKVALTYFINDNFTAFTSFSKGYMPGGFNITAQQGGTNENMFEAQKSDNYELGIKYQGEKWLFNASIFKMDITDIHVYKYLNPTTNITDNAKKGHSQGIEIDGKYFITNNFNISGSLGLINAKYDDYDNGTKYDGERIERTPKYSATLSLSYTPLQGVYGQIDFLAKGKTSFFDGANKSMIEVNESIITNAKVGYKVKNWDIYAFAKNLTNEDYVTSYLSSTGTDYFAKLNEQRFFGLGLIYKF